MVAPVGEVKSDEVKLEDAGGEKEKGIAPQSLVKRFVPFIVAGGVLVVVVIVIGFLFGGGSRRTQPAGVTVSVTALLLSVKPGNLVLRLRF